MKCWQMGEGTIIRFHTDKKGFITTEASIVLPIFIIGILTLAFLMKFIYIQEHVLYSLCDEAKKSSKNAYYLNAPLVFPLLAEARLKSEAEHTKYIRTTFFLPEFSEEGIDGLIQYDMKYLVDIPFPIRMHDGLIGKESVVFRGLTGRKYGQDKTSVEEMEEKKDEVTVWVFPMSGEKFHQKSCAHIAVFPVRGILTSELKKKFRGCLSCDSGKMEQGEVIYYFQKAGEAYHGGECSTVDKYVMEMEADLAIQKGYVPCKSCGGY